eukprot:INCI17139.15.p1 GENE.INCI17139.15~~INCI17139.15.p1  ORF type:complete len:193 (+),score=19.00 INCI17139.15:259-837(+)
MLVPVDLYRLQNVAQTIGRSCGVDDLALILRNRATQFAFPSRVIPGKEGSRNVRFSVKVHPLRRTLLQLLCVVISAFANIPPLQMTVNASVHNFMDGRHRCEVTFSDWLALRSHQVRLNVAGCNTLRTRMIDFDWLWSRKCLRVLDSVAENTFHTRGCEVIEEPSQKVPRRCNYDPLFQRPYSVHTKNVKCK